MSQPFTNLLRKKHRSKFIVLRFSCASNRSALKDKYDILFTQVPTSTQTIASYIEDTLKIPLDVVMSVSAANEGSMSSNSVSADLWDSILMQDFLWPEQIIHSQPKISKPKPKSTSNHNANKKEHRDTKDEDDDEEEENGSNDTETSSSTSTSSSSSSEDEDDDDDEMDSKSGKDTLQATRRLEIILAEGFVDAQLGRMGMSASSADAGDEEIILPEIRKELLTTNTERPHPEGILVRMAWDDAKDEAEFSSGAISMDFIGALEIPEFISEYQKSTSTSSSTTSSSSSLSCPVSLGKSIHLLELGKWYDATQAALDATAAYRQKKNSVGVMPFGDEDEDEDDDDDDDDGKKNGEGCKNDEKNSLGMKIIGTFSPQRNPGEYVPTSTATCEQAILLASEDVRPFDQFALARYIHPATRHVYYCFVGRFPPPDLRSKTKTILYNEFDVLYTDTLKSIMAKQGDFWILRRDAPSWMKKKKELSAATSKTNKADDGAQEGGGEEEEEFATFCSLDESLLLGNAFHREEQSKRQLLNCAQDLGLRLPETIPYALKEKDEKKNKKKKSSSSSSSSSKPKSKPPKH